MSEVAKTVKDKRLLKLIRRLLTVGILSNGLVKASDQGTPQGNPLSPLLSNIMLDLLDKELERRGHKFCRFGDDCNVYVRSQRVGQRVMHSLTNFIEKKLKLKVNRTKSAVDRVHRRSFVGFSFLHNRSPKIRISSKAIKRFKDTIRELTRMGKWTRAQEVIARVAKYCRGWLAYFGFSQTPSKLKILASWVRRRLRNVLWKQWETAKNRTKQLINLGVNHDLVKARRGTNKSDW